MERDFEREFKELKQSEIPDLWNRIEAGLSEKKNATSAPGNAIAFDNGYRVERRSFEKKGYEGGTIKKQPVWKKWGTLIAACVCAVVILPALSLLIRNKSYSGGDTLSSAATEEIACDSTVTQAVTEDAAAAETGAGAAEAGAEDMAAAAEETADNADGMVGNAGAADADGMVGNAGAADADGMVGNAGAADADGMAGNAGTADAGGYNAASNEAASAEAEEDAVPEEDLEGLEDGQTLEAVVIQIQKAETAGTEAVYWAVVLQADADGILHNGTQIAIVCDGEMTYDFPSGPRDDKELKEQETYRVSLCFDAEKGRFVVLTVERWEGALR